MMKWLKRLLFGEYEIYRVNDGLVIQTSNSRKFCIEETSAYNEWAMLESEPKRYSWRYKK